MKTKPYIIKFNGMGQSADPEIKSGTIAILLQDGEIELVMIEILPPDEFGPELIHADNISDIRDEIISYLESIDLSLLTGDSHWLIKCPEYISLKAHFPDEVDG